MNQVSIARRPKAKRLAINAKAVDWLLVFVSLAGLTIGKTLGSAGAFVFLLASVLLAITRLQSLAEVTYRNSWVFVLPSLFFLSTMWSDYPMDTLRGSIQYFVTVAAAIIMGSCVRPRVLISACFAALLLTAVICLMLGLNGYLQGDEAALLLLLGSKNQLAETGAFFALTSLSVLFDRLQPKTLRALALAGIAIAIVLLYLGASAGSSVFIIPALFVMLALMALSPMPSQIRVAVIVVALMLMMAAGFAATSFINDPSEILDSLGKDSTLTGRADLWRTAQEYFSERPVLGLGYQAFWQIGNPRAELQWFLNNVPSGAGFNFHNLYLNTAVELGSVGLAALAALLLSMIGRLLLSLFSPIATKQIYAIGLFVYLLGISTFEVIQTYQFMLGTVLFYVSWCYLKPRWE